MPSKRRRLFEAIQRDDPWRHVALTVRAPGTDHIAAITEAARRLDHPGIAPLIAAHADAVAVAWTRGRGLDRALTTIDDDGRLELAIQIADLVAHAHARGVVLRDLKPSNLLLDQSDGRRRVTLVDLDLARVETSALAPVAARGTWGWSAPEQAVLEPRWIDRRSDLYALGTTLAFVFSGASLFSRGAIAVREQLVEDRLATLALPDAARALVRSLVVLDRDARRPAVEVLDALRALRGERPSRRIARIPRAEAVGARRAPSVLEISRSPRTVTGARTTGRGEPLGTVIALFPRDAGVAEVANHDGVALAVARTPYAVPSTAAARDAAPATHAAPHPATIPGSGDAGATSERDASDAAFSAFRATIETPVHEGLGLDERLAIARSCLLLGDRDAARIHAEEVREQRFDHPAALAILARAALDDGALANARGLLDRVTSLPAATDVAHALLAAEVAAMRPRRALILARGSGLPDRLDHVRALCHTWLTELGALTWDQRLAWDAVQADAPEIVTAMVDAFTAAGGPARAFSGSAATARVSESSIGDAARHRAIATALADEGNLTAAVDASSESVTCAPHSHAAWFLCADLMIADARAADALDLLGACDSACGASPDAERLRASAWLALDELDRAISAGQRALAGEAQPPALWHILALAWIGLGNGRDATTAARTIERAGDPQRCATLLAFYAALATDDMTEYRDVLASDALATYEDPDLALLHGLSLLGNGPAATVAAEHVLSSVHAAEPDLAPVRATRLAIRGMTPSLAHAIEHALDEATSPALTWAAAQYYLATGHPGIAASLLHDHAATSPSLAAEAFVRAADSAALRLVAPALDDLAETVARRMRC